MSEPSSQRPSLTVSSAPPPGLFDPGDTKYDTYRDNITDPSLREMVEAALRLLSRNPRGFYLFVEGEQGCGMGGWDRE